VVTVSLVVLRDDQTMSDNGVHINEQNIGSGVQRIHILNFPMGTESTRLTVFECTAKNDGLQCCAVVLNEACHFTWYIMAFACYLRWISMEHFVGMRGFPVSFPAHGVLLVFFVPEHRPIMPREITPVRWMRPEEFSIPFVLREQHELDDTKTFGTIPSTQRIPISVLEASDGKSRK
jgi:hypothetical protein